MTLIHMWLDSIVLNKPQWGQKGDNNNLLTTWVHSWWGSSSGIILLYVGPHHIIYSRHAKHKKIDIQLISQASAPPLSFRAIMHCSLLLARLFLAYIPRLMIDSIYGASSIYAHNGIRKLMVGFSSKMQTDRWGSFGQEHLFYKTRRFLLVGLEF